MSKPTSSILRSGPIAWVALGLSLAAVALVSAIGGWASSAAIPEWYQGLAKPKLNPPDWVFAPVWTLLYILMAIAAWRVWRRATGSARGWALGLYTVQLGLNLLWSLLFFAARRPDLALIEIALLLAAIWATIIAFRRIDRCAAWAMAPYLAWVAFASYLNFAIWRLN